MNNYTPHYDSDLASPNLTAIGPVRRHTISPRPTLVDVFTLANHFRVHHRTAQRWTKNGLVPHYRVGKSVRYDLAEVTRAVAIPAA